METTKVWVQEAFVIGAPRLYWPALFAVRFPVPSLEAVCGLQNVTFWADSELTEPFAGTASVPADLYPN